MSELFTILPAETAHKLTEATDLYQASRMQYAVNKLDIDVVLSALDADELAIDMMEDMDLELIADYATLLKATAEEDDELSNSEKLQIAYAEFDIEAARRFGKIGSYALGPVDADEIILRDIRSPINVMGGDEPIDASTITLSGLGDGLATGVKRVAQKPNPPETMAFEPADELLIDIALDKLHEIARNLSPKK